MNFNKEDIKEELQTSDIFELLLEFGGEPEYTDFGIISATICHNKPGFGSHKLYYYNNSKLFKCYTGCDNSFDIFELICKVFKIQKGKDYNLNDAVRFVAYRFNLSGYISLENNKIENEDELEIFKRYNRIKDIEVRDYHVILNEYDRNILDKLNYNVKIIPWEKEGISPEAMKLNKIGFYPGADQITIPHFDINNRFIGLRGRCLCFEEAKKYGKYKPIKINDTLYTHPLGMNLYGLNLNKNNIQKLKTAIIFESEKSVLLYETLFGRDLNIATACCGSSISFYQIQYLLDLGVNEIIIAFDRQFQEIGDEEYQHLKNLLIKIQQKYKNYTKVSIIFDKNKITSYKASPIDEGKEKFITLFNNRICL